MATRLPPKHARFVREYLIDHNGKQAAIRAGYSKKTAESQGSRLLRNAKVAAAVADGEARVAVKLDTTADDIAAELRRMGFANLGDYFTVDRTGRPVVDLAKLTPAQTAALAEIDARDKKRIKFKLHDKLGALVALAKMTGLWREKVDVELFDHEGYLREIAQRKIAAKGAKA